jgi:chromosomal replication initiation ATPase DnaA
LGKNLNANVDVVFKVEEEVYTPTASTPVVIHSSSSNINKNYTFDNFIVTNFNKSAYNAAQSIFRKIH